MFGLSSRPPIARRTRGRHDAPWHHITIRSLINRRPDQLPPVWVFYAYQHRLSSTKRQGAADGRDHPLLLILNRPPESLELKADRGRLHFAESAGTVLLMPLFGRGARNTESWVHRVPADVVEQARTWSMRLRRVPIAVSETFESRDTGIRIKENFEYLEIRDTWGTPARPGAPVPPIFSLAGASGGPIRLDDDAVDALWLAGDVQAEQLGTCLLARGLAVKYALAWHHQYLVEHNRSPGLPSSFPAGTFSGDPDFRAWAPVNLESNHLGFCRHPKWGGQWHYQFFADLTPEIGRFLYDHARTPVRANVQVTQWRFPGYWLSKGLFVYLRHETQLVQPWGPWAGFLAQAFALQESPERL